MIAPHRRREKAISCPSADEFEARLMRSQADSERLMEAVVGRMLAEE